MIKVKHLSIRKRLFIGILAYSVILLVLITSIVSFITYKTMQEQLIYNRRTSIRWLQDRLTSEVENTLDKFYDFEVNKKMRDNITSWYSRDEELNYTKKLELISTMNETISMDENMNSMQIYNYTKDKVLIAERDEAKMQDIGNGLDQWNNRDKSLQTNIVYLPGKKEITIAHQIFNFSNKQPMVLVTMKIRPYKMEETLENIKTTDDETILLFNDQNELIQAVYGSSAKLSNSELLKIVDKLENADVQEVFQDNSFWFFREVKGGKLKILMSVPNSAIVSALNNTIYAGILIGIFAIIIATVVSLLFSRTFSKPIIELSAMMRTITIDKFSDVIVKDRQDEIGILHDSFNIMIDRNKRLIAEEYQSKIEKREAQLRALQAQINPHFMYNTLQVIGGMSLKNSVSGIYKITTALGDIMRYSLNFSNEMVALKEEIQYFQAYITIQNERFGNRINLEINIPPELLCCLIPKLILQPLLENCMEHGLVNKSGEWRIILTGSLTSEGDLLLTLEDNGIGITKERLELLQENLKKEAEKTLKSDSHIGLCNVNSRIRLKFSEDKYGVSIISTYGEGTRVELLTKAIGEDQVNDEI